MAEKIDIRKALDSGKYYLDEPRPTDDGSIAAIEEEYEAKKRVLEDEYRAKLQEAKKKLVARQLDWHQRVDILFSLFKSDLLEYLELTRHPKAEAMLDLAWEQHDDLYEVVNRAEDLAALLKD